jgi:homoserine O-acetyltransferase
LVGPGLALDTDRWFVVAPNVLGGCQGSTGPAGPDPRGRAWGSRFPHLTVRDQVGAELALADALGVDRWALVVGGSMGGMRALEWAVGAPQRVERLLVLATGAYATGDQIAWCSPQLAAIRADAGFRDGDYYDAPAGQGPHLGLGVARRIAHATYRSGAELNLRFGRKPQPGEHPVGGCGRFAVESYHDHHADNLVGRFAAVDSDRLYPVELNREIADGIAGCPGVQVIASPFGHDGFLIETEAVADLVAGLLAR